CQCFSVLEDGALAHSLQEQEIEQFYSSNLQKNQAVQNDVRLARRLQDEEEEEEEERVQLTQQLQQLEEQDCEYARMVQEELRRCDEEAQRREEEDEGAGHQEAVGGSATPLSNC
ncbi:coiled-coil domain-containing protein 50, partial [Tachysurus ichikawai]